MLRKFKSFWKLLQDMKVYYSGIPTNYSCYRWDKELERRLNSPEYLERYGFKVYSQNDEDGIISEIFSRIGTTNKVFIEFGVQDGLECNTHYLLHENWSGLWIEGDKKYYKAITDKFSALICNARGGPPPPRAKGSRIYISVWW
jgi:hypothetical protein